MEGTYTVELAETAGDRAEERKDPASDGRVFHFCAAASNERAAARCYHHDESSQGNGASYGFSL